jgi:hypothetical protein
MSTIRARIGEAMNWIAANARTFSYMLPDSLEIVFYIGLAIYFASELSQQA